MSSPEDSQICSNAKPIVPLSNTRGNGAKKFSQIPTPRQETKRANLYMCNSQISLMSDLKVLALVACKCLHFLFVLFEFHGLNNGMFYTGHRRTLPQGAFRFQRNSREESQRTPDSEDR